MDGFRFMQNDRIVIFGDIKAVQKICKNS
jgi:hypothetical protein